MGKSDKIEGFNLSSNPFVDRRKTERRSEDRLPRFCEEHGVLTTKLEGFFSYFKETDKLHEARMEKLEQQIEKVDKKIDRQVKEFDDKFDRLYQDLPEIVAKSFENVFMNKVWLGIKKFFKLLAGLLLFAIAGAIVAVLIPELADFLKNLSSAL